MVDFFRLSFAFYVFCIVNLVVKLFTVVKYR